MRRLADTYRQDSVLSMTPEQVLLRLYDGLLLRIAEAERALADGQRGLVGEAVGRALDILGTLRESLDVNSEAAAVPQLDQLYETVSHWLLQANLHQSDEPLQNSRRVLEVLQRGWKDAIEIAHAD